MSIKNRNSKNNSQAKTSKEYPYKGYEIYLYSAALLSFVPFLLMVIYFSGLAIWNCIVIILIMSAVLISQLILIFKKFNIFKKSNPFKEFRVPYSAIFVIELLVFLLLVIRRCDEDLLLGFLKQHNNNPHCVYINFVSLLFLFVFSIIVYLQLLVESKLDSLKIDIDFDSNIEKDLSIKNELMFYSALHYAYKGISIVFVAMAVIFGLPKI